MGRMSFTGSNCLGSHPTQPGTLPGMEHPWIQNLKITLILLWNKAVLSPAASWTLWVILLSIGGSQVASVGSVPPGLQTLSFAGSSGSLVWHCGVLATILRLVSLRQKDLYRLVANTVFNVCISEANSILAGWEAVRDINIPRPNDSPAFRITLRSLLSSAHWRILLLGFGRVKSFANRNRTFKAFGCFGHKLLSLEEL